MIEIPGKVLAAEKIQQPNGSVSDQQPAIGPDCGGRKILFHSSNELRARSFIARSEEGFKRRLKRPLAVRRPRDLEWLAPAAHALAIRPEFCRAVRRAALVLRARAPAEVFPDAGCPEALLAAARWDCPALPGVFPEAQLAFCASLIMLRLLYPGTGSVNGRDAAMFPAAEVWNLRHSLAGVWVIFLGAAYCCGSCQPRRNRAIACRRGNRPAIRCGTDVR
jgi:hypothetical protein